MATVRCINLQFELYLILVVAVDAIIVAVETQDDYLKKKKTWTRKMVVLTDGESPIEVEDWELTVKKINELRIITTIM